MACGPLISKGEGSGAATCIPVLMVASFDNAITVKIWTEGEPKA